MADNPPPPGRGNRRSSPLQPDYPYSKRTVFALPSLPPLPNLRSAAAATLYVNLLIVVLGFATSVAASRWLGPAGRGELAAALAVSTLLPYIASMGLASSVLYHSASRHEGPPRTLGTALPVAVVQAAVFGGAAWFVLPVLMQSQSERVVFGAQLSLIALPANLLLLYLVGALQSQLRFADFNILRLVLPTGSLLGVLVLQLTGSLTPRSILSLYITLPFATLLAAFIHMVRNRMVTALRPRMATLRRLFRYGLQAQAGDLANSLNVRLDQVLIAAWLPVDQLGLYVAALGGGSVVSMLGYSVQLVLQPRLLNEPTVAGRDRLLKQGIYRYLVAGSAVAIGLIGVLPLAIPRIFGASFKEAVPSSQLLVAAALILGLKSVLAGAAHAYGAPWLASKAELAGLVVTVVTLAIFLPTFGIEGAAISSISAYAMQACIISVGLHRRGRVESGT